MLKSKLLAIISITLILFSFTACNTGTKTQDSKEVGSTKNQLNTVNSNSKLIDPYSLISKEDAQQLINETLKDPEKTENKVVGLKICFFKPTNQESFKFFQVSLSQKAFMSKEVLESGQNPKTIYESTKGFSEKPLMVDGIGDEAFIAPPGIHILKGDYYITIAIGNSEMEENRKILKEAGKKAMENLEKALK